MGKSLHFKTRISHFPCTDTWGLLHWLFYMHSWIKAILVYIWIIPLKHTHTRETLNAKICEEQVEKNTLYLCSPEDDTSSQQTHSPTDTYLQQAYISHVNTWKHLKGRKKVFCRLPHEGDSSHIKIDVVWNREQTGSDRDQTGSQPSRLWAPRPFYNDLRFNLQYDWRHSL